MCVSFSRMDSRWCIYYLFAWSNFNFLHNSQWITFPIQAYLVLYLLYNSPLRFIVLVVSCFLPEDSRKGGTYMRKRIEAQRERERERERETERERERERETVIREKQIGKWTAGSWNLGQDSSGYFEYASWSFIVHFGVYLYFPRSIDGCLWFLFSLFRSYGRQVF